MAAVNPVVDQVTQRIRQRSAESRRRYLERVARARRDGPARSRLSCGNLAHGFAACAGPEKQALAGARRANIAIVSSYNDMLSAHQPLERFPSVIKPAVWEAGGVAQFAGGVPAMCDGVTQGRAGMELSLFSRDVIAMATAVALSHDMFDGVLCLGVCDKIVPGLLIGALSFGHLPVIFVPGGPMPSGLPNAEKSRVRELFAEGRVGRAELLEAESASYHSPGTCTFYGTANTNQLLMEVMGLHLPGASFVNPGTPLRDELTRAASRRVVEISALGTQYIPIAEIVDEKAIVNAIVALLASGGSTNHTIHLVAIARAAGLVIDWDDFATLSEQVPLLARVYPNGLADVNHFHAAGGIALMVRELLAAGLLHEDVRTIMDAGLSAYLREPFLEEQGLHWKDGAERSLDPEVLSSVASPFSPTGGLKVLEGNLGRAIMKTSAVDPSHRRVQAPARVFASQDALLAAFREGALDRDVVAVVQYQGPRANGMPELHKLTPTLGVLQDRGHSVALVTDGRMSGASGKVPAAIQVTPECFAGGALARVRDGDMILVDGDGSKLELLVDESELRERTPAPFDTAASAQGTGRELFAAFRRGVDSAELGASPLFATWEVN